MSVMDTARADAAELIEELENVTEMIRARTKRLYKDSEILWRLSAKQSDLMRQVSHHDDTQDKGH